MKRKWVNGTTLLAVMAVLLVVGCQQAEGSLSSDATIAGVKVAGVDALTLGTPSMDWTEAVTKHGHIYLNNDLLKSAASVEVRKSVEASTVYLARGASNQEPNFVSENQFTFVSDDYLFVESFSENHDQYLIYAIQVHNRNPGIVDMTLGGRAAVGGQSAAGQTIPSFGRLGNPAATWNGIAAADEGEIWFADTQAGQTLPVTVTTELPSSYIKVAVAGGDSEPSFTGIAAGPTAQGVATGLSVAPADGTYLYIQVKGDAFSGETYYKLKMVAKKNDRTLKFARFVWYNGTTKLGERVMNLGTMGTASWSGSEAYGSYTDGAEIEKGNGTINTTVDYTSGSILSLYPDTGARPPTNFSVVLEIQGNDPGLQFKFDIDKNQRASPDFDKAAVKQNDISLGNYGNLLGFWWWAVEATTPMGEKGWYKFATNIGSERAELGSLKINGQPVDISSLQGNSTSVDASNSYIVHRLAATYSGTIKVEAQPANGYQSIIGMASSPDLITDIPQITFNLNSDENYDSTTHTNTSNLVVESGQFVFIRVLAETAWYYGGSGFAAAAWNPLRGTTSSASAPYIADPGSTYAPYKYYKIKIVKGDNDATAITGIKYGTQTLSSVPNPVVVTSNYNTSYFDNKGNLASPTTNVTTSWSTESVDLQTPTFANVTVKAELPTGSTAKVAYGIGGAPNTVVTDFSNTTGVFESIASNSYVVARVTSANDEKVAYYRFRPLNTGGNSSTATAIKINNSAITVGTGNTTEATWTPGTPVVITHTLNNKTDFATVTVDVTKPHTAAAVDFALMDDSNPPSNAPVAWNNGDKVFKNVPFSKYVYIRVRSADRTSTTYYKVRLLLAGAKTGATITGVKINNVAISPAPTANTSITGIPASGPNPAVPATYVLYGLSAQTGFTNLKAEVVGASAGASVAYAAAATNNTDVPYDIDDTDVTKVTNWTKTGTFASFTPAQFLVIRVASEDNQTINYYKVRLVFGNSNTALTNITVNSSGNVTPLPTANTSDLAVDPKGNVTGSVGTAFVDYIIAWPSNLDSVTVAAVPPTGASVAYAVSATNTDKALPAAFTPSGTFANFVTGQYVFIRVVSSDTTETRYYKVRLLGGNQETNTAISRLTVNGNQVTVPTANGIEIGMTAGTYTSAVVLSPVRVAANADIRSTVTYGIAPDASTAPTSYSANGTFNNFVSGQYVVIRVTAPAGNSSYYKVKVNHGNNTYALTDIKVNGTSIGSLPTANEASSSTDYKGNVTYTVGTNSQDYSVPTGGFTNVTITAIPQDSAVKIAYAVSATNTANQMPNTFAESGSLGSFTAGQYVFIRVVSSDSTETRYYKVRLISL